MISYRAALLVALFAALAPISGHAGTVDQLGNPAPPLAVSAWLKGTPVRIQPGTNFYTVIFCELSRASDTALTNLYALQKDYQDKGLSMVVVSADSPQDAKDFISRHAALVNFAVATDDLGGKTLNSYQRAFEEFRSPVAYVINKDGAVVWFGHPLTDDLGEVVDRLAAGKLDLAEEKQDVFRLREMDLYMMLARQNDSRTHAAGRLLIKEFTNDAPALLVLAGNIAQDAHIQHRDVGVAAAALKRAEQISNTNATAIAIDRAILLFQTGKMDEGLAKAQAALAAAKTDDDKQFATQNVRAMETRIAAAKNPQTNSPAANP